MLNNLLIRTIIMKNNLVNRLKSEKGSNMVTSIILVALALGLAFIFKDKIETLIEKVFAQTSGAIDTLSPSTP